MYCPSCGNEIPVELKYCNRCGANLAIVPETYSVPAPKPIKVAFPVIVLGLTIVGGLGIIMGGSSELASRQVNPAAIVWIVIFSMATLFGCTALMLRFWLKILSMSREVYQPQIQLRPPVQMPAQVAGARPVYQPRLEPMPSVTEHTTRTFSRAYREGADPEAR